MKKRILAMLLCIVMCLSMLPQVAFAEEDNASDDVVTEDTATVIEGTDEDIADNTETIIVSDNTANVITGFAALDEASSTFIINKADKPDLESLTAAFPSTITAYLSDGAEVILDVTWVCDDEDYTTSEAYLFMFYPEWDTDSYPLADALDYYMDVPYIPVYFTEDAGVMPLDDTTTRTTAENIQIIYEFLTNEMGLNVAAACGVLANIQHESGFNPNAVGDKDANGNPTSYGICQWHDSAEGVGRWSTMKAFCEENGYDWTTLEGQLYYLQYELSANNYKVLYNGKTIYNYLKSVANLPEGAYDAAYFWCYYFEIPSNRETTSQKRGAIAQTEYWPEYCGDVVSSLSFTDVPVSEWYYGYVEYAYKNELMNGMSDTKFEPAGSLTRAQFAVILYRVEGTPNVSASNIFSDVLNNDWYTKGVLWASSKSVVNGYPDGTFGVSRSITREEMATMMYRYAKMKEYDVENKADFSSYKDAAKVSDYAKEAFQWAVACGIITGRTDGTLDPQGSATRAECATIMTRFVRLY